MLAVDTNVLVRYLTEDDPVQSARAKDLIDSQDVFVPVTVVLEVAWVLRSFYRFDTAAVLNALRGFAGLKRVTLQNAEQVHRALEWAAVGVQFGDALHLAMISDVAAFVTFDRALAKRMTGRSPVEVQLLSR